jgi:hypothetical protein
MSIEPPKSQLSNMKIENHNKVNLHRSDAIIFTVQKIVTIIPRVITFWVSAVTIWRNINDRSLKFVSIKLVTLYFLWSLSLLYKRKCLLFEFIKYLMYSILVYIMDQIHQIFYTPKKQTLGEPIIYIYRKHISCSYSKML